MKFEFIKDDKWMKKIKERNFPYPEQCRRVKNRQYYLRNRKRILNEGYVKTHINKVAKYKLVIKDLVDRYIKKAA